MNNQSKTDLREQTYFRLNGQLEKIKRALGSVIGQYASLGEARARNLSTVYDDLKREQDAIYKEHFHD